MPSFSISAWLPSLTSWATRSRSRMICSTVSPPMMDRRWPANTRPTRTSMRSCSDRNRRAAFAIDAWSSPTLNAATARTFRRMPWFVMHSSTISASRRASESTRAFCFTGTTKLPCPVTMRNCVPSSEISSASFGAGTCQKSMAVSPRAVFLVVTAGTGSRTPNEPIGIRRPRSGCAARSAHRTRPRRPRCRRAPAAAPRRARPPGWIP